jgi:hypothetical protein
MGPGCVVAKHCASRSKTSIWNSDVDLNDLLPKLATYLGHTGLAGTQRYLTMAQMLYGDTEPAARIDSCAGAIHWRTQPAACRVVCTNSDCADKEEHDSQSDIS